MQTPALSPRPSNPEDRYARKARILLDLFGPSGVDRLKRAGLSDGLDRVLSEGGEADKDMAIGRGALLKKLRDNGLLDPEESKQLPALATPASSPAGAPIPLTARIAEFLDDATLGKEHPAVIAMVLRGQSRPVQMKVLRALPGATARATMRYLKG